MSDSSLKSGATRGMLVALLIGSAVGAGAASLAISGSSFAATTPPISVAPSNPQPGFSQLVARVKPAVVQIATISPAGRGEGPVEGQNEEQDGQEMQQMPDLPAPFGDMLRRFGQQPRGGAMAEQRALGSGFIVDPAGYIVTNNHVVDGAQNISVTLSDGAKYKAKVIGVDSKTDLALLKIEAGHTLPYVAFGDSDNAREGDWVIAVGNPYGLGGTVTAGIVSAHGRNINSGPYDDFMQIDAPINPGNSGGPLFNQTGQVVGIDTAIYSPSGGSVGIGFAIPSNVAHHIVDQLRASGQVARGWLGVQMQPLTPALAKAAGLPNDQGVLVDTVTEGSPASRADLHQGDVITGFNGKPVKDARDLAMDVAGTPSGHGASMTVWRDNHSRSVDVTIGTEGQTKTASAAAETGVKPVGMSLEALTPDVRDQLNVGATVGGVLVGEVTPGSNADESGVQAGDIIVRVGNSPVTSPDQVVNAIHTAQHQNRQALAVLVLRNGVTSYLGLDLA
jgi:serine protease Do